MDEDIGSWGDYSVCTSRDLRKMSRNGDPAAEAELYVRSQPQGEVHMTDEVAGREC